MNRRADALKAAKFTLELDPSNIDNRKLYDKIEATPSLGVKKSEPGRGYNIAANIFWLFAILFLLILPATFVWQGKIGDAIATFFVLGMPATFLAGKFSDWADVKEARAKAFEREYYKD
jgi:hypothetical protein